jgi:hypothetical protein
MPQEMEIFSCYPGPIKIDAVTPGFLKAVDSEIKKAEKIFHYILKFKINNK